MAEKILQTRILNKVATLQEWNESTLKIKKGELCFATVAASAGTGLTEPVVMVKIGTEEEKTFAELPWAFHAKASDVLAACKSEDALTAFINNVIADAGIASDEAMEELAGRVDTAEGKIATIEGEMDAVESKSAANETAIGVLNGLVGDTAVAAQIDAKITALNLASTYEAKGEAAKVQTALETYKTSNDAAVQKNATDIAGEIARAKAAEEANAAAINTIKDGTTIDSFADVEAALAGKQGTGNYSEVGHKHEIADVNGLEAAIADAKKAGTDAAAAAQTAQDGVDALNELVGDDSVSDQIDAKIAALDLANTYDVKGAAAAAETAAKSHADGLNTAMNARVEALEAIDHSHANEAVLNGITAEKVAAWDAAEQNAKDHADGLNTTMDGRVAALEAKFGDGEGNVEAQIEAAVAAEAELREAADADLLEKINANDTDILALQGIVGDGSVEERINAAVAAEAEIARAAEKANADAIKAISDDYLVAADKTELEGKIKSNTDAISLLTNGADPDVVDGVNDLITYVAEHGTEVTGMKADIKQNADDIDALEGRMTTAEGAVATKAEQADLEVLAGRVTTAEGKITTLEGEMDAAEGAITALQTKVGDESVADQIDSKIEAALKVEGAEKYALAADLASAEQTHATDKAALEASIALKANDADLAAIAKTGNVNDLVQTDGDVLIFDCGGVN